MLWLVAQSAVKLRTRRSTEETPASLSLIHECTKTSFSRLKRHWSVHARLACSKAFVRRFCRTLHGSRMLVRTQNIGVILSARALLQLHETASSAAKPIFCRRPCAGKSGRVPHGWSDLGARPGPRECTDAPFSRPASTLFLLLPPQRPELFLPCPCMLAVCQGYRMERFGWSGVKSS